MLISVCVKKTACVCVVWRVNVNALHTLSKLGQKCIERLIVLAVNQPAIQRRIQIIKQGKDAEFKVFEVFGVQRQISVLRVGGFFEQVLFQDQVEFEFLVHHAEFMPFGDL